MEEIILKMDVSPTSGCAGECFIFMVFFAPFSNETVANCVVDIIIHVLQSVRRHRKFFSRAVCRLFVDDTTVIL